MIPDFIYQFIAIDLPAVSTALFAALSCALLGNFLVLRRLGLMGDAISHGVLPGIVIAFLISGTRSSLTIFIGAAIAALLTAVFVELLRRVGRIDEGAAMGVVFSLFFALGVLLLEQAAARNVDLDADCLLHGQLETIFWYPPTSWNVLLKMQSLSLLPAELWASAAVWLLTVGFVVLLFKELTIAAFDADLSTALGYNSSVLHYALMLFVALAVVASFEAVGSILVIAMLICPAATARFFTDRLHTQIYLSLLFSALAVVLGYFLAAFLPTLLGFDTALNAAGMMATVLGLFLAFASIFARPYGRLSQYLRRKKLSAKVLEEDILSYMYRRDEQNPGCSLAIKKICLDLHAATEIPASLQRLIQMKDITTIDEDTVELTPAGRKRAAQVIRSHRLWERYLVDEAGLEADHVHQRAEDLEHFTDANLSKRLAERHLSGERDPHGQSIPDLLPEKDSKK